MSYHLTMELDKIKTYEFKAKNFIDIAGTDEGHSHSHRAISRHTNDEVIIRSLPPDESPEEIQAMLGHVRLLTTLHHPCIAQFFGFIMNDELMNQEGCIITKFYKNGSLEQLLHGQMNGEVPDGWDLTRIMIILYGISSAMNYIHGQNVLHRSLSASNVVLDEEMNPLITDIGISKLDFVEHPNDIIYKSPEILNGAEYSKKSDIYAFGIIASQLLKGVINVYEDIIQDNSQIKANVIAGVTPSLPENLPKELINLIASCLNKESDRCSSFNDITISIENIFESLKGKDEPISAFDDFKNKINQVTDQMDDEIKAFKQAADKGDVKMMILYAKARKKGHKCTANETEAIRYYKMASDMGDEAATRQLSNSQRAGRTLSGSIGSISSQNDAALRTSITELEKYEEQKAESENDNDNEFISLAKDNFFKKGKFDINQLVNDVKLNYNKKKIVEFDEKELTKQNFIFTDGARDRLTKLHNYITCGVPVLLEGPTGTSKTLSAEEVCSLLGITLVRFNLSSETKTSDLLGRYIGDPDSWAGISMNEGPFIKAFSEGYCLLLDEINLASQSVLQCIEEALDSGVISIEIPGMPLKTLRMHENFRLIATQNPNKGLFAHKRQDLGLKFLSRFQVINFPAFTKEELMKIAEGLAKGFEFKGNKNIIKELVDFHIEWSNHQSVVEDAQCFTVREIAATVKAFADGENVYDTVMTIYGARYQNNKRNLMISILNKYKSLINSSEKFDYPFDFPDCFHNKALSNTLKSVFFSFKNHRHVILSGSEGCGKTQVARWISEWYDKQNSSDDNALSDFFCVCTEETKCSDLIGHQKPSDTTEAGSELIRWENGFLTNAIIDGKCAVLDSLDEAPATVTERLNGLLDQKYDGKPKMFDIPENPANRQIMINPSFKLLCTCNIDKISQISPAFLNRFDIIVLEDQLDGISDQSKKELITLLMNRYGSSQSNVNRPVINEIHDEDDDDDFFNDGIEFDDEGDEEAEHSNDANPASDETSTIENYIPPDNLIGLIQGKLANSTFDFLSRLCKAVTKYSQIMKPSNGFKPEDIVEFSFNILKGDSDFEIPANIQGHLLSMFKPMQKNDDSDFFFDDSPLLKKFMAKLMACSLINQHVCVYGPTGAGKTSAARAFARIRQCNSLSSPPFQMHSFHSGTKPNHFYGSTTLKNKKIYFHNGTLTTAMINGDTFIADEMNLSSASCMKSLAPALEANLGRSIFIPGIDKSIIIRQDFFFIACQNELGTLGRNAVPPSISSRFRYFDYPKQEPEDIASICVSISKSKYQQGEIRTVTDDEAKRVGYFMLKLNQMKQRIIPQWSLRDISKIYNRIYNQETNANLFIGISVVHQVLFYTLSPVSDEDLDTILMPIIDLLSETFNLDANSKHDLIDCYNVPPLIKTNNGSKYIMKGDNVGISLVHLKSNTCINDENLYSYNIGLESLWNSIFKVLLSDTSEPILLMGPSGFKTFLSQIFLPESSVITLNQESTIAQLLGSSGFFTSSEAKLFYLEYICKISEQYSEYPRLRAKWEKVELKKEDVTGLFGHSHA